MCYLYLKTYEEKKHNLSKITNVSLPFSYFSICIYIYIYIYIYKFINIYKFIVFLDFFNIISTVTDVKNPM